MSIYRSTDSVKNAGWKYGQNKSNSVLMHSDTYLGEDYSDGIKHYKYIKKEKKNGKMRYYYHDTDLEDADRAAKETYDEAQKLRNKVLKSKDNYEIENLRLREAGESWSTTSINGNKSNLRKYHEADELAKKTSTIRNGIYFKKIPSRIIGNGKAFLMNLFDKILG